MTIEYETMPSHADQLCALCGDALQPKRGDAYKNITFYGSRGRGADDNKLNRSWDPVRTWFDQHSREVANRAMKDRNTCYTILNYVYLKDAPEDIVDRFLRLDCLTLLQLCMLALSRAKEPYDEERRSKSWDPVRKWFETPCSLERACKNLEETNHVGETVLECVSKKQAPKDIFTAVAGLQKTAAKRGDKVGANNRLAARAGPSGVSGGAVSNGRSVGEDDAGAGVGRSAWAARSAPPMEGMEDVTSRVRSAPIQRLEDMTRYTYQPFPSSLVRQTALGHQVARTSVSSAPSAQPDSNRIIHPSQLGQAGTSNNFPDVPVLFGRDYHLPDGSNESLSANVEGQPRGTVVDLPKRPSLKSPHLNNDVLRATGDISYLTAARSNNSHSREGVGMAAQRHQGSDPGDVLSQIIARHIERQTTPESRPGKHKDHEVTKPHQIKASELKLLRRVNDLPGRISHGLSNQENTHATKRNPKEPIGSLERTLAGSQALPIFSSRGEIISREELIKIRRRNGLCLTCGQICFKKKLFKLEPITEAGKVFKGLCLSCQPQDLTSALSAPAPWRNWRRRSHNQGASLSVSVPNSRTSTAAPYPVTSTGGFEVNNNDRGTASSSAASPSRLAPPASAAPDIGTKTSTEETWQSKPSSGEATTEPGDFLAQLVAQNSEETARIVPADRNFNAELHLEESGDFSLSAPDAMATARQSRTTSSPGNFPANLEITAEDEYGRVSALSARASWEGDEDNISGNDSLQALECAEETEYDSRSFNKPAAMTRQRPSQENECTRRGDYTNGANTQQVSCQPPIFAKPLYHAVGSVDYKRNIPQLDTLLARIESHEKDPAPDANIISDKESASAGVKGQVLADVPGVCVKSLIAKIESHENAPAPDANVISDKESASAGVEGQVLADVPGVSVKSKKETFSTNTRSGSGGAGDGRKMPASNQHAGYPAQAPQDAPLTQAGYVHINADENFTTAMGVQGGGLEDIVQAKMQAMQVADATGVDQLDNFSLNDERSRSWGDAASTETHAQQQPSPPATMSSLIETNASSLTLPTSNRHAGYLAQAPPPQDAPLTQASFVHINADENFTTAMGVQGGGLEDILQAKMQATQGADATGVDQLDNCSLNGESSRSWGDAASTETHARQQPSSPATMSSLIETNAPSLTLLELCGQALHPEFEADESKINESWEPVRVWFDNNTECHDSLLQRDSRGYTPLHIACSKRAPIGIVKLMIENDNDSSAAKTKDKEGEHDNMIPLHWACYMGCCPEVTLLLFQAYPKGANERNFDGNTPFRLAPPGSIEKLIRWILECDYEAIGLCKDFMSPDIFQEGIMKNHNSPTCIQWLNRMSCSRRVVFHMMLEFYLHIALIVCFIQASELHLSREEASPGWAIAMLPISGVFLLLECWQFKGYLLIGEPSGYLLDWWNWIDLTTIGLTCSSAVKIYIEEPVLISMDEATGTRRLLMATGFLLCFFFVSYLRKTLYPFAIFVGGMANIIWVLIPFMVVSFLLIGAFAFGYFVQDYNEVEYQSLGGSFLSVYSPFIGGEEEAESALDIAFGSLIIVVLLNVVIAVVGQAWSDVTRNSKEVFWKYRLRFILEVTRGDNSQARCCGNMLGLRNILDNDWTTSKLKQYLGFTMCQGRQGGLYRNPTRGGKRDNFLQVGMTIFLLSYFTILGLVSFGLPWPMFVLEFLFTSRGAESSANRTDDHAKKALQDKIEKLSSEQTEKIDHQSEQIKTITSQLEQLTRQIELLVEQTINGMVVEQTNVERESEGGNTVSKRSLAVAVPYPNGRSLPQSLVQRQQQDIVPVIAADCSLIEQMIRETTGTMQIRRDSI